MNPFFLILLATAAVAFAAPLELSLANIETTDAKASRTAAGLVQVETGHQLQWPGVKVVAPDGHWDLSRFGFVEIAVKNTEMYPLRAGH